MIKSPVPITREQLTVDIQTALNNLLDTFQEDITIIGGDGALVEIISDTNESLHFKLTVDLEVERLNVGT